MLELAEKFVDFYPDGEKSQIPSRLDYAPKHRVGFFNLGW